MWAGGLVKEKLKSFSVIAALVAFVVIGVLSFRDIAQTQYYFSRSAFHFITALLLLWTWQIMKFRSEIRAAVSNRRRTILALVSAAVLASVVFYSVPPGFRTLSDETNLLAVSKSMVYGHNIYNTTIGKFYFGNFYGIANEIPTRPLVFPYLTHLVHTVLGFSGNNAFVLNFLILTALFFTLFFLFYRIADFKTALGVTLLTAAYPVVTLFATSSGFDLCSSYFFLICLLLLLQFVRAPNGRAFGLLWLALIVFANIRYESMAIFFIVIAGLFVMGYLRRSILWENRFILAGTPLLFLPLIWQQMLSRGKYENAPGIPLFSFDHFWNHGKDFFKSYFDFTRALPYASLMSLVGFPALMLLIYWVVQKKHVFQQKWLRDAFLIILASVAANTAIFLAHHAGIPSHPAQARFFLFFSLSLVLAVSLVKIFKPLWCSSRNFLFASAALFLFYHPMAVENRYTNALILDREAEVCFRFLSRLKEPGVFVIADRPGMFTALNYGAADFNFANRNRVSLLNDIRNHLFSEVIVFQRFAYATQAPVENYRLDPEFKLSPVYEFQLTATEFMRVSRIESLSFLLPPTAPSSGPNAVGSAKSAAGPKAPGK